jgi:hypothetical protein
MKRDYSEIKDNIYEEEDIEINKKKFKKLQEKYDPNKKLILKISPDVTFEFEKSDDYINLLNEFINRRYYKKLKIEEKNDKNKNENNENIIEYNNSKNKNICTIGNDLTTVIENTKECDTIEVYVDDNELMVEKFSDDSEIVVLTDETEGNNEEGDKTITYFIKIAKKNI